MGDALTIVYPISAAGTELAGQSDIVDRSPISI